MAAPEPPPTTPPDDRASGRFERLRPADLKLDIGREREPEVVRRVRPPTLAPAARRSERLRPVRRILPEPAPRLDSDALEPDVSG